MELLISPATLHGHQINTVNARSLYFALQIRKDFSSWVKAQIKRFTLVYGAHYVASQAAYGKHSSGGRPTIEYHLTIDAAKEIAAKSYTKMGNEVRNYLLACERELSLSVE